VRAQRRRQIAVKTARVNVAGADIVVGRHHKVWQHGLSRRGGRRRRVELGKLAEDSVWAHVGERIKLPLARGLGTLICEINNHALVLADRVYQGTAGEGVAVDDDGNVCAITAFCIELEVRRPHFSALVRPCNLGVGGNSRRGLEETR
jgi:hypothetical protein